ncbi:MAG: cation diffusion facilitator family transporter [Alphaproteobacteria bacterium]|nr:cation diffusion facilitator family transporter [Alphaproteobacteria bacterium]
MTSPAPNPLTPEQKEFRRKWVVLFSALESLVGTFIKITAAWLTGSTALVADAIHSAADVAGSFIVWIGVRLAPHKYKRFPYGFYKIENLLALAIGFAILYGAYEILMIFLSGEAPLPENIPIGVTAVILGMALDYFWGSFEARSGRLMNSPGIEASGNHTVSDVYSSMVVLAGLVGAFFGVNLDRWAALIVAMIITKIGLEILWDNVKVLLDISLPKDRLDAMRKIVARQPGVLAVQSIRGRDAGSFRFVDVEIDIKAFSLDQANATADTIEKALKDHDEAIDTVFVHYRHEFPATLKLFVPTDATGEVISEEFGKTGHFSIIEYNRLENKVLSRKIVENPHARSEKHRGINLATTLIDQGVDSVCSREDLHDKGPGLMFHRFGIDVRVTEATEVASLMKNYMENSTSVFPENNA